MLRVWGVGAANAPLEVIFPPQTGVVALPDISIAKSNILTAVVIQNFARASGLMLRVWVVDATIDPLEAISPS